MESELINTVLKTIAMLFIVLGLLVLILYLIKRMMLPKGKVKGDLVIKVVSSLYLSPKDRVEVIEISGERIILGVTPGNINFLTKLDRYKEDVRNMDRIGRDHEIT